MLLEENPLKKKTKLQAREAAIFAMLGALMFLTKYLMQVLPNIHLLALFIASVTLVYRWKALVPIYIYVLIDGIVGGFAMWWLPYLYIWLPLWGAVMIVSSFRMPRRVQVPVYMVLCGLHGLCFGLLYAPVQAIFFGLNFQGMVAWIVAGLPFDAIHAASNFVAGSLAVPLAALMRKLNKVY